jgi:predicted ferric reductase
MGVASLLFVAAHPLLLARSGLDWRAWSPFGGPIQMGALALWATAIIVVTSLVRRRLTLSYETWQIVHLAGAVVIVSGALVHVFEVGGYSSARPMQWMLIAYAGLFGALLVRYRLLRPLLLLRRPWEVVANQDAGGSTRLLRVRPVGHAGVSFDPGQFAWLITGSTPIWAQQHPLSIASSAEPRAGSSLEFAIKALGDWSSRTVPALAPGARVWVDGAFGAFTPDREPALGFVLIAGGIGIAPMRSMLLTMRDRDDARPVLLFYAAADFTRVAFRDEIDQLTRQLNLRVVYGLERPGPDWTGERGFITAETLGRHRPPHVRHYQYYVCGPVPMMDAMERILVQAGVPPGRVHTERFQMV